MKPRHRILIVDDESFVRDSLVDLLEAEGYATSAASGKDEALKMLETERVSVIVTDLRMPGGDGISLLQEARKRDVEAPVILLTGVGTVPEAVEAMKSGAHDFIQKPVESKEFVVLIRRAIEHLDLVSEVKYLRTAVRGLQGSVEIVGSSRAMATVRSLAAQVAPADATVLILGESGTGKELVAAAVHRQSRRAAKNFIRVNCAAIPESLFESEFFGHRRGAFTSAVSDRVGRFAEAEGGTLALDEIGTLRPEMQAKLLHVLETGEYQVVGESRMRVADVRIIASTNEDLGQRVRQGAFRLDLYYRINIFPIEVPPLRRRKEDIPELSEAFLARARARGRPVPAGESPKSLSSVALEALAAYDWPGNVRELRNVMERASILSPSGIIEADLIQRLLAAAPSMDKEGAAHPGEESLHLRQRVDALERQLLTEALARSGGKKGEAASLLGIDPRNLSYYLKKHGSSEAPAEALGGAEP